MPLFIEDTGHYCRECEFFEPRPLDLDGSRCMSCGCPESSHVEVKIVSGDDD